MAIAPFTPDHNDRIAIARGWRVLGQLVTALGLLVAGIGQASQTRSLANAAYRLARIGEALARRLLLVRALSSPLPEVAPFTRAAREAFARMAVNRRRDPQDVRYVPPPETTPRLRLAEPLAHFPGQNQRPGRLRNGRLPAYRVEQYGVLTVHIHRVGGIEAEGLPDVSRPLERRLSALKAVADDPARAARRMARWLARQRATQHGRSGPMRPGRAPGQVRARHRDMHQNALSDIDYVALNAIARNRRHRTENSSLTALA